MNLLIWIVIGGVVGWVMTLAVPDPVASYTPNVVLGVIGAVLSGWLLPTLAGNTIAVEPTVFHVGAAVLATMGALIIVAVWNIVRPRHE